MSKIIKKKKLPDDIFLRYLIVEKDVEPNKSY